MKFSSFIVPNFNFLQIGMMTSCVAGAGAAGAGTAGDYAYGAGAGAAGAGTSGDHAYGPGVAGAVTAGDYSYGAGTAGALTEDKRWEIAFQKALQCNLRVRDMLLRRVSMSTWHYKQIKWETLKYEFIKDGMSTTWINLFSMHWNWAMDELPQEFRNMMLNHKHEIDEAYDVHRDEFVHTIITEDKEWKARMIVQEANYAAACAALRADSNQT